MPRVMIDAKPVDVPEGTTILEAARRVDVDIPALCHYDGLPPNTSCMLCVVEIEGRNGVVPACAHPVSDGMVVKTETPKLCELRRVGLEMLLCDHVGDCHAPCQHTCPLDLDVPAMLRHVGRGDLRAAIETIRTDMALPAVLGRVCPELCERTCRRAVVDQPAAVCRIKQFVADEDAAGGDPYLPNAGAPTGKRVAVIGAGPAGLSAAYYLALAGHKCVIYESRDKPGGRLITDFDSETLPESVVASEVALLERLGVTIQYGRKIEGASALRDLVESHDAVLLAVGRLNGEAEDVFGLPVQKARLRVGPHTWQTSTDHVFACGDLVHPTDLVVLCVAGGKRAAFGINEVLSGIPDGSRREIDVRTRVPSLDSLSSWLRDRDRNRPERIDTRSVLTLEDMQCEAERCLGCDCQHRDGCLLRQYSERYGASKPPSGTGDVPLLARRLVGPSTEFEPGKCIRCGICVALSEARGEPIGVTFKGRGYALRIDLPFASSNPRGLDRSAAECIHACPTGALSATDECLGVSLAVS